MAHTNAIKVEGAKAIEESGIVPKHAEVIKKVAKDTGVIILFRNVNSLCTTLIEQNYGTKGLHIKPKSADWGPQAGFLGGDQRYSKCLPGEWETFNKKVLESLKDAAGYGVVVQLKINKARIDELEKLKVIKVTKKETKNKDGDTEILMAAADNDPNHKVSFKGVMKKGEDKFSIFVESDDKRARLEGWDKAGTTKAGFVKFVPKKGAVTQPPFPLIVIADAISGVPLTADYDLLGLAVRQEDLDLGGKDRLADPGVGTVGKNMSLDEYKKKKETRIEKLTQEGLVKIEKENDTGKKKVLAEALEKQIQIERSSYAKIVEAIKDAKDKLDKDKGNTSKRMNEICDAINKGVKGVGYTGGNVIHHGAETGNPWTAMDYPVAAFEPDGKVWAVGPEAGLKTYHEEITKKGYVFIINPMWTAPSWTQATKGDKNQAQWDVNYRLGDGWKNKDQLESLLGRKLQEVNK